MKSKFGSRERRESLKHSVELLEADVLGVFPEATSAHVETVLTDETVVVGADAAEKYICKII